MSIDTTVVLRNDCMEVYYAAAWPPDLPPLVEACPPGRRATRLFSMIKEYGKPIEAGSSMDAVVLPGWLLYATTALAISLYAAEPDKNAVRELYSETPASIVALIKDAMKLSRDKGGRAVIARKYYMRFARIINEVMRIHMELAEEEAEEWVKQKLGIKA
jgi:hypothetical protein